MTKKVDAIIIGAGIIGCATAFELAKKGYKTLSIDKMGDAGSGSTSNSCAIIRFHYSTHEGITMAYEGYFYWKDWANYLEAADERGFARYRETGMLVLNEYEGQYDRTIEHFKNIGVPFEEWDNDQVVNRYPLGTGLYGPPKLPAEDGFWDDPHGSLAGGIYNPQGGYVTDPQLATHNLMRAAEAKGGEFIFNAEVAKVHRDAGRVAGVTLKDGTRIDAPIVVNAAGPHSFVINRMAGVEEGMKIKTNALRHEVHTVPSPAGFNYEQDGVVAHCADVGVYWRPEVGNSLIVGSADPDCDPKEWVADPDHFAREVTEERWKAQVYRLAKRMPTLEIPNTARGLVDLYDVSDDWIPIYDKSDLPGFYMAVGTSGNQFKNAAVAGHLMSELIDACEHGHDHDADPVQVMCRYTPHTLDAGFYSRRREINAESSFSVLG
ncbi:MAG: NAD(P)/FAD-dependent oxidoreductase [Anaerolineales bacterium]